MPGWLSRPAARASREALARGGALRLRKGGDDLHRLERNGAIDRVVVGQVDATHGARPSSRTMR